MFIILVPLAVSIYKSDENLSEGEERSDGKMEKVKRKRGVEYNTSTSWLTNSADSIFLSSITMPSRSTISNWLCKIVHRYKEHEGE